jgi:hypothetical protein
VKSTKRLGKEVKSMSKSKSKFKQSMVSEALKVSEVLGSSPLAPQLGAHGFTPASMANEAKELTQLRTQYLVAKAALAKASGALADRAETFAQFWAAYSNIVRGLTTDEALRKQHGVATLGKQKGPRFHRPPKTASTPTSGGAASGSTGSTGSTSGPSGHA